MPSTHSKQLDLLAEFDNRSKLFKESRNSLMPSPALETQLSASVIQFSICMSNFIVISSISVLVPDANLFLKCKERDKITRRGTGKRSNLLF